MVTRAFTCILSDTQLSLNKKNYKHMLKLFLTYLIFYRLLTTTKEDATGGVFHLSAPDTVFGKVYQNNMDDDNSYKGQNTISSALKHPKTAFYYNRAKVLGRKEYKTCQVKNLLENECQHI